MKHKLLNSLFFISLCSLITLAPAYAENNEVLSPEQLSQCLARERNLETRAEQLNKRSEELQMLNDKLQQLEQQREREYADINFHDADSVNEYNHINQQIKQSSELYLGEADIFNRNVRQYKTNVNKLESECNQKRYYKQE